MAESAAVVDLAGGHPRPVIDLDHYAHGPAIRALDATGDLGEVIAALGRAVCSIEARVGAGHLGEEDRPAAGAVNVQGEVQISLDVESNEAVLHELAPVRAVAAVVSEELAHPHLMASHEPRGEYLLAIDPLDGSSNTAVNIPVGTIFSVLRRSGRGAPQLVDFLQPGRDQVCAGFALYGPATVLVLATAGSVVAFTLDRDTGTFVLTNPELRVAEHASEFAINASNERFWPDPIRRFVADCLAGRTGPRGQDYNMRWVASLVAEAYRILSRGGVFLYPADSRSTTRAGRLRLLYECNPIAFVMEQAGGAASTGLGRVLDLPPTGIHQRIPFVFGSRAEVQLVEAYHHDIPPEQVVFPLFNGRTLFRGR
jgi:fructose-1,6-bisphosphatase I/sedoheptulose-1,7-bisphosphatase